MRNAWGLGIVLGVCGLIALRATESFPLEPRQGRAFIVLGILLAGTALLIWRLRAARDGLRMDLVQPMLVRVLFMFGLALTVMAFITPAWSDPFLEVEIGLMAFNITVLFVLLVVCHVAYAAWITPLVMDRAADAPLRSLRRLGEVPRRFMRTFTLLAIGVIVSIGIAMLMGFMFIQLKMGTVGLVIGALLMLAWSIATAPLLLTGLTTDKALKPAIVGSLKLARRGWRRWALPVFAQMVLLGFVTYVSVTFSTSSHTPGGLQERTIGMWTHVRPVGETTSTTVTNRYEWSVNSTWIGGYEDDSEWPDDLMDALESWTPSIVDFLCMLLLGIASLAVKLHVARAVLDLERSPVEPQGGTSPPSPAVIALLAGALLFAGCGDGPRTRRPKEDWEPAFRAVEAGRFHVRGRRLFELKASPDPEGRELELMLKDMTADSDDARAYGYGYEYICGSDAVLRLEMTDRTLEETFDLSEADDGEAPAAGDPRILAAEVDVRAGQRLIVILGVDVFSRKQHRARLAVYGAEGPMRAWRATPRKLEERGPWGPGQLIEREVHAARSIRGPGTSFDLRTPDTSLHGWLAADMGERFPIMDILRIAQGRFGQSGSSRSTNIMNGRRREVYSSGSLTIVSEDMKHQIEVDGEPVTDLTKWPDAVWMLRGTFSPR